jgi:hypothetical protein
VPLPSSSGAPLAQVRGGERSSDVGSGLADYPELKVVLSLAVDTVAQACGIDQGSSDVALLQKAATVAMLDFYAPVVATAARLAAQVEQARAARAAAVARLVDFKAAWANSTAAALHARQEREADAGAEVAAHRALAAEVVQESVRQIAVEDAAAAEAAALAVHHDTRNAAAGVEPHARATCYHLALVAAAAAAAALDDTRRTPLEISGRSAGT